MAKEPKRVAIVKFETNGVPGMDGMPKNDFSYISQASLILAETEFQGDHDLSTRKVMTGFFRPDGNISATSFRLNGVTPDDIESSPKFKAGERESDAYFAAMSQCDYVVCHNSDFIESVLRAAGYDTSGIEYIDTMTIASSLYGFDSNSLYSIVMEKELYRNERGAYGGIVKYLEANGIATDPYDVSKLARSVLWASHIKNFAKEAMLEFGYDLEKLSEISNNVEWVKFGGKNRKISNLGDHELLSVYTVYDDSAKIRKSVLSEINRRGIAAVPAFTTGKYRWRPINDLSIPRDYLEFMKDYYSKGDKADPKMAKALETEIEKRIGIESMTKAGLKNGVKPADLAKKFATFEELERYAIASGQPMPKRSEDSDNDMAAGPAKEGPRYPKNRGYNRGRLAKPDIDIGGR